jgi:exodeoxyribonuclease VII large subunit
MEQPSLFLPQSLTVSDLTRYVRALLENNELLKDVWVLGEISNLTRASSGHVYLTLKDAGAALRAVIWRTSAQRLRVNLQNGMAVEAHGAIAVYEPNGVYQLIIDTLRPAGEGDLYRQFLLLKERLEAEGLFAEERKRTLPAFPRLIGVVTSPTGAALQDMLNTLQRRYPLAEVLLAPTLVQGDEAPGQIVQALSALNRLSPPPDVIIVARGGGSLEDLWAFNDERVVRAIAASAIPVVSGIGHETDFTLSDFAADLRAPTPTGAATLVSPDRADLRVGLERLRAQLEAAQRVQLAGLEATFTALQARLLRVSPMRRVQDERQRLDNLGERLGRSARHLVELRRSAWQGSAARLQALNPLAVLERGYAVVQRAEGGLITRISQAQPGQQVRVRLSDGRFGAEITSIERKEEHP